jgi:thiamine-phosphate pyrophosphorylase
MTLPAFYPILDTTLLGRRGFECVAAAEAILEGGARILQFRHKTFFSRDVFAQAEQIRRLCVDSGAVYVVNDRADIAMLLAAGLHVGQDDLPPEAARRVIGDARLLGFSTHNEAQLRDAARERTDYLAFGPIFGTLSKETPDPVVGLSELRRLRPVATKPLVAIGGITRATARDVLDAGANSVAIISDLLPDTLSRRSLRSRTEEWLQLLSR